MPSVRSEAECVTPSYALLHVFAKDLVNQGSVRSKYVVTCVNVNRFCEPNL